MESIALESSDVPAEEKLEQKVIEFRIEGGRIPDYVNVGKMNDTAGGYYSLTFPEANFVYRFPDLKRSDVQTGDIAFQRFAGDRLFEDIEEIQGPLREALQIYAEEKKRNIIWYEKTYRFVYRGSETSRFNPGGECDVFALTTDKSNINPKYRNKK